MFSGCVAAWLVATPVIAAGPSDAPDRTRVHDTLKRYWDSVGSLEIRAETYVCDESGERSTRPNLHHGDLHLCRARGDRFSYSIAHIGPDGSPGKSRHFREDGRKHYDIESFRGDPDSVNYVVVKDQVSTEDDYRELMCVPLWLWMPGGRPLHARIDDGAALEVERGEDGREVVVLISEHKGLPLRCELDPAHDWLPRKVVLGDVMEYVVRRFGRDNGRWFPVEGFSTWHTDLEGVSKYNGYTITTLRIDRPLDAATFRLPPLPQGAWVNDYTGGKSSIEGGIGARRRLLAMHPDPESPDPAADAAPGGVPAGVAVASREAYRFPWSVVLAGSAVGLLALAWRMNRS